jgi:hypothetical protein
MRNGLSAALRGTRALALPRLLRLNLVARTTGHQRFEDQIDGEEDVWRAALAKAASGRRILLATDMGGHFGLAAIDRVLAMALTLRGAYVTSVLCDRALPACLMCEIDLVPEAARFAAKGPPRLLCSYCHGPAAERLDALALPQQRLSAHVTATERAEAAEIARTTPATALGGFVWEGLPVGEHARAGALRFFARGTLDDEPRGEAVSRKFLEGALVTAMAYRHLVAQTRPDVMVVHHGIYAPQGIVAAVARAAGIRLVTWNPAYRRHCLICSHDDTYHHTLMTEPTARWDQRRLSDEARAKTVEYLESRRRGEGDWIRFHQAPAAVAERLGALGLDPGKPLISAFTNVFWDAQLHYPANAFAGQGDWLIETIRAFAARPDLQLAIRVHPAELTGSPPSRQKAADEIAKAFPALPSNVVLIGPESALSSYELAELSDTVLIYATKMGVELSARGIPVIVAGEAWVRGKGITEDARSPAHYRALLKALPHRARLDHERTERAIAYAHHFFFRRMIPVRAIDAAPGPRRFQLVATSLRELGPGGDAGLDVICRGILEGTPFEASDA